MMKTRFLLMLLAVVGLMASTAQANMLLNPGFEEGTFTGPSNHTPDDWVHYSTYYSPAHVWVDDSAEAHSGEKYMKMYNWFHVQTYWTSTSAYLGQDVPGVKEDGDYTFTVWAKNDAEDQVNEAGVKVDWRDSFGNWIASDYVAIPVANSDWIELDFGVFTAPEGTGAGTAWLVAPVSNGLNAICYDDIIMLGPDPNINAGPDMISWNGQTVSLTGSESLPGGYTTITWSAEPADGVSIVGGDTFEPDVTITLPSPDMTTYNMTTYKLTLDIDGEGKYDVVKIDVYPDACAAWLGAGLREATDIVGDDCITDLADLAEIANTWTDDNALTEPTAKDQGDGPEPVLRLGANARDIAIVNAGFEDPQMEDGTYIEGIDGWDPFGDAWYGVSNVGVEGGDYWGYYGIAPEGQNIGIIGGGDELDRIEMGMAQILAETLATDLTYELTVEVGNTPHYDWAGYRVQLLAGGIVIAEDDSTLTPALNTFETSLVMYVYTPGVSDPDLIGKPLEIRLIALGFSSGDNYLEVNWDDVRLRAGIPFDLNSSPADGDYISPVSELELSWANMPPFDPNDPEVVYDPNGPVWVDVWFGTDPNDYNDFNKIVDAVEDADSVTVDASTLGETYYWQMKWYLYGDPATVVYNIDPTDPNSDPDGLPVIEWPLLSFYAAFDVPVSVDAGIDMVTWLGQAVALASTVIDDGKSDLTIEWSADPNVVVFDPNGFVEAPTVTIDQWTYSAANIVNAGFEYVVLADGIMIQAINGWHKTGGSWIETVNPGDGVGYDAYGGIAPEGNNIALAVATGGGLAQFLLETLAAKTTYELIVEVGNPPQYNWAGYKVQLLAGGITLSEDDNSVTIATDTFGTSTVTYNSGATPAQLGEPLEIRLICLGNGLNFDDVRLTADPPFDPTWSRTVTLTVSVEDEVGSDEDTITIDMYDTACLATIDLGLAKYDTGDLNADCDTDLADFAAMAKEWLVYNELAGSIVKP